MRKTDIFFNVLRLPVDFLMLLLAGLATYLLRTEILSSFRPVLFEINLPLLHYIYLVFVVSFLFIGAFAVTGLYSLKNRLSLADEIIKIIIGSSTGLMALIIYIFLRQELFNSRFLVLGGWILSILFVFMGRLITRYIQSRMISRYGFGVHKILIIDGSGKSEHIRQELIKDPSHGFRVVDTIFKPDTALVKLAIEKDNIDEVVIVGFSHLEDGIVGLIDFCHYNHVAVKLVPAVYQSSATAHVDLDMFNGIPLIELKRTKLDGWGRVIKRSSDIVLSILGLVILSPIMALIAFAVKWETAGPAVISLRRVSGNREFDLFKFRSMIENAHELNPYLRAHFNDRPGEGPLWKMRNDPRVTKIGSFIRMYRLDEIPQLWNILKGDISLVGPRPHQIDEIEKYASRHKKVLTIKAGATGLAQVSGSSDITFDEEVSLDSFYIDNWSIFLDIKIILLTMVKIVVDRSAV